MISMFNNTCYWMKEHSKERGEGKGKERREEDKKGGQRGGEKEEESWKKQDRREGREAQGKKDLENSSLKNWILLLVEHLFKG